jgi:hypothetical protein
MKNNQTAVNIIRVVLTLLLIGGFIGVLQYYLALENKKKEWYESYYLDKKIKGEIKDIEDYDYNEDFNKKYVGLTISTAKEEIHYGMLSIEKEPLLNSFIEVGDSIYKNATEKVLTVKKNNGSTKTFELPIDIRE